MILYRNIEYNINRAEQGKCSISYAADSSTFRCITFRFDINKQDICHNPIELPSTTKYYKW